MTIVTPWEIELTFAAIVFVWAIAELLVRATLAKWRSEYEKAWRQSVATIKQHEKDE